MSDFKSKSYEELNNEEQIAVEAAMEAITNSYSPYSEFEVGAALLLEDGTVVIGSNQENMAYPSGICAERSALFAYGSSGSNSPVKILTVFARHHGTEKLATGAPCGGCRQVMLEYEIKQNEPYSVIFYHDDNYIVASSCKALLPFHFHLDNPDE